MVDGHIATATTRGDNYHLDLDGILYLGKCAFLYNSAGVRLNLRKECGVRVRTVRSATLVVFYTLVHMCAFLYEGL